MTWFVESPWPSLMTGLAIEIILAIVLVRTGRAAVLVAMAVVLGLTTGMLVLERLIVTETEEVEDALDAVAAALVAGDAPTVMASLSADCPRRGEVQSAMSRFSIRAAHVGGDLEVRVNHLTSPPSAKTFFTGRIEAKDSRGVVPYEHMIRKFQVTLRKEKGRWLIADYADAEIGGRR